MNAKRVFLSLTVLALALAAVNDVQANPQVFDKVLRSTVLVILPGAGKDQNDFIGSGALIDAKKKWVVTNYHVCEQRDKAVVFFPVFEGGRCITDPKHYVKNAAKLGIPAKVLARDKKRDLALLELKSVPTGAPELTLAAKSPRPGETLHTVGNSGITNVNHGTLWRYTRGEVRQVYKTKFKTGTGSGPTFEVEATVVETQAPINGGDSGGPVVNERSELVAVNQSHHPKDRLITYGIDVGEVRAFLRTVNSTSNATAKK